MLVLEEVIVLLEYIVDTLHKESRGFLGHKGVTLPPENGFTLQVRPIKLHLAAVMLHNSERGLDIVMDLCTPQKL